MEKLKDIQVKNSKFDDKSFKLSDGAGLYLLVNNTGKYWRYDYRYLKKRKTLALGVYPEITLKKARKEHKKAREILADGIDPGHLRKVNKDDKLEAAENSFAKLAWEWFNKQKWTEGHRRTVKSRLENDVIPWIGNRPVNEITAKEVLTVCRRVEKRGAIESAHRIKTICSQVFRYCVASELIDSDPCRDLSNALTPTNSKHMATITDPAKVGALMRAIEGYEGNPITRAGLQLAPLVFVRPGELRHAEWSEFDLENAIWKIPSEKMKMRQPHLVPLSKQAVEIIKDIKPLTGKRRYLFPSVRSTVRPMSNNTILAALRRMGYAKEEITGHGFRGMASTLLHEQNWDTKLIERQLAHIDKNSVRAAYNHAEYMPERTKMMQAWADYLEGLKHGGEVINLRRKV